VWFKGAGKELGGLRRGSERCFVAKLSMSCLSVALDKELFFRLFLRERMAGSHFDMIGSYE